MACKGWLGNAASTGSSGIVAAAFHSTATNAKSYKTQLKSLYRSLLSILPAFCEGTDLFWKAKSVDKCSGGLKVNKPKKCGEGYWTFPWSAVCVQTLPENDKDKMHWLRHYVTMSLCPMWCDFLFQQPLHIVTTSWMILSNAWHGLQRLARKRSFHRLVWHSGCCLSFNGHKREILQDTIEVLEVYSQSFLHFVRALICFGKPSRLTNAPVG